MAYTPTLYNFVPLNEKVFFPPWAKFVNYDIPFKQGISGQIKLDIIAETPIFIRKPYEDGDLFYPENEPDKTKRISKEFCHIKDKNENKRYYIPGSSIRNMLRSVVEIMSFSKLTYFNDDNYTGESSSVSKAIKKTQKDYNSDKLDMTELIFGDIKNQTIKGRVHISHAFSDDAKVGDKYHTVLLSPNVKTHPFYVKKTDTNEITIAGRKRYYLKKIAISSATRNQDNVSTKIDSLKPDTTFETILLFHNLLPEELGALLSAITFHNNTNCRHNIGAAKAFGLGQIKITSKLINLKDNVNTNPTNDMVHYMKKFEQEISKEIDNWHNTTQLTELLTMASVKSKEIINSFIKDEIEQFNFNQIVTELKSQSKYSKVINYPEKVQSLIESNTKIEIPTKEKHDVIDKLSKHKPSEIIDTTKQVNITKEKEVIEERIINDNISKLTNYSFKTLKVSDNIDIIITNDTLKEATIIVDSKIIKGQLSLEKWIDKAKLQKGQLINVVVKQISVKKKFIQVKLTNQQ